MFPVKCFVHMIQTGNANGYLDSLDKKISGLLFKVSGNIFRGTTNAIIAKVFGNEEVLNHFCIINSKNIYRFTEMSA